MNFRCMVYDVEIHNMVTRLGLRAWITEFARDQILKIVNIHVLKDLKLMQYKIIIKKMYTHVNTIRSGGLLMQQGRRCFQFLFIYPQNYPRVLARGFGKNTCLPIFSLSSTIIKILTSKKNDAYTYGGKTKAKGIRGRK